MARNWGICIGVSEYRFHRDLKYAHRDAEELGKLLKEEAKFEKIYTFTKDSPPIEDIKSEFPSSPERSNFIQWLKQRFPKSRTKPLSISDNLWFSFSGHGWEYQGKHYLLFSDTTSDEDDLPITSISVEYIREHLRKYSGAGNIIMFIDACRESGRRSIANYIDKQQGVITIASCEPSGLSYEIEELGHGSFTFALLESLQLLGEGNCATVERLCNRLRNRVKELNLKYQKPPQRPYSVIEPDSKYHLILLPEYIKPSLDDIACLEREALKAEVKGDYETAEIMWQNLVRFNQDEALEALRRIWSITSLSSIPRISDEKQTNQIVTGVKSTSNLVLDSSRELIEKTLGTGTTLQVFDFETPTVNTSGKEIKRESHSAQYFTEDLGNDISLDMVLISGGKFFMGTDDKEIERLVKKFDWDGYRREKPQHQVTVQSFFMGKYPVTQRQWKAIAELPKVERDLKPNPSNFKGDDRPVESITWYDAVEFCARLSKLTGREYRLPGEAEWEYACRAVASEHLSVNSKLTVEEWNEKYHQPFHFGETITTDLANYSGENIYADEPKGVSRGETTPVASFLPNTFGLYDMHGNVWEWCADSWHDNYNNAPYDGSAWLDAEKSNLVVVRGGSWFLNPFYCRSAFRDYYSRDFSYSLIGFRVVCVGGRTL